MNRQGIKNYNTARKILSILGGGKKKKDSALCAGALMGLTEACADCDKYGPKDGNPCMSLQMAREFGVEYDPPPWCKDPGERNT